MSIIVFLCCPFNQILSLVCELGVYAPVEPAKRNEDCHELVRGEFEELLYCDFIVVSDGWVFEWERLVLGLGASSYFLADLQKYLFVGD